MVTQMATPLGFHDLFSHQVSGSQITGCPLLLSELRVVWTMGYLEKVATTVIGSSEISCLSKTKIFSRKDWCPSEFSAQNRIKEWLEVSLPDRPLYFECASVFPQRSLDTVEPDTEPQCDPARTRQSGRAVPSLMLVTRSLNTDYPHFCFLFYTRF